MGKIEKKKVWTGVFIVPPLVLLIAFGPTAVFIVLVLLAIFFGLREFYTLSLPHSNAVDRLLGTGLALVLSLILSHAGPDTVFPFFVLVLLILTVFAMATAEDLSSTVSRMAVIFFGIFYIGYLLSYVSMVRTMPNGRTWVLFLISTVWAGDISALLGGSYFGRHKLYPKISPNKTYEGLVGAVVGSVLVALAFALAFIPSLDASTCIVIGIGLGLFGQLGDFTESLVKRSARVKDSGSLFPGHGGMLDRIDSFLFSAPFLHYCLLYLVKETR
jgi:phosphatidate cytidylyltransferase